MSLAFGCKNQGPGERQMALAEIEISGEQFQTVLLGNLKLEKL